MHSIILLVKQPLLPWAPISLVILSPYAWLQFFFQSLPLELIRNMVCLPSISQDQLFYLTTFWYYAIPWLSNVIRNKNERKTWCSQYSWIRALLMVWVPTLCNDLFVMSFFPVAVLKIVFFLSSGCFCHQDTMNHCHPCLCYYKIS